MDLNNLSFKCDNKVIISNVSLKINNSEKLAVVGKSGAGKSMLSDLIMNFRNPTLGDVCINGNPINDILRTSGFEITFLSYLRIFN